MSGDRPTDLVLAESDGASRRRLTEILNDAGYRCQAMADSWDLLALDDLPGTDCLILDYNLKGLDGTAYLRRMVASGAVLPPVVAIGPNDVDAVTRIVRAGAIDYIPRPVSEVLLLDAVASVNDKISPATRIAQDHEVLAIRNRMDSLTPRQAAVMDMVYQGYTSKEIAKALEISLSTVTFHRREMMERMRAGSVNDLARMITLVVNSSEPE